MRLLLSSGALRGVGGFQGGLRRLPSFRRLAENDDPVRLLPKYLLDLSLLLYKKLVGRELQH